MLSHVARCLLRVPLDVHALSETHFKGPEGVVLREFVPLKVVGTHPKSRMPLAAEFRIFWLSGKPIVASLLGRPGNV